MLGHVNLGPGNGYCRGARDLPQPAALRKDLQMQVLQQELRVSMAGLSVEQCRVQFIIECETNGAVLQLLPLAYTVQLMALCSPTVLVTWLAKLMLPSPLRWCCAPLTQPAVRT